MSTDLKERTVSVKIDGIPSHEASFEQLTEAIELLAKEAREKSRGLFRDDEQSDASSGAEESLPQPKVLQLSEDEQLSIHLQRPETNVAARNEWSTIDAALKKNTEFMQALKAHENMGAELTVVEVETDENGKIFAVEFENVADSLDIGAQEAALAALTAGNQEAYIQDRVSQFYERDRAEAETWIRGLLERLADASGLNYIEADMLVWTHGGGQLISHDSLQTQAERKPELWESTLTWHKGNLAEIKNSGLAWVGNRREGNARQGRNYAVFRNNIRGGRASRLRVQIA